MSSLWKNIGLFAGGVLFGTAGISILTSRDAKKVYTHTTAACLRGREAVLKTATTLRENCDDILVDAKAINEKREAAEDAVIADESQTEFTEA